jgi:hypothetical protein
MAAAWPQTDDPAQQRRRSPDGADDAARAEMARLLLEGARRLRREREAAETRRRTPAKRGRPLEARPEGA